MSKFDDEIEAHLENLDRALLQTFRGSAEDVQDSITNGSAVTGAPGQPVQSGHLKGSFIPQFLEKWIWETTTMVVYAPFIEEGGYVKHSKVGGPHSVRLTRIGWDKIVEVNAKKYGTEGTTREVKVD